MVKKFQRPNILTLDNGTSIAYHFTPGRCPGVVFLPGFKSDMEGSKALALETYCNIRGNAFLRFDYQGHGQSSGDFDDGTIGGWASDAINALDHLTTGPQVLVGSSMGGWIMLLLARARPNRVSGLLGVASAPDFTKDLISNQLSASQKSELNEMGHVLTENAYAPHEPYRINKKLLDESEQHLTLDNPLKLNVPIRLIHGICDKDVPWSTSIRILEKVTSDDIEVTLIKAGDHRLSEERDLKRLRSELDGLLNQVEKSSS